MVVEYLFNNNANDESGNGFHTTVNGAKSVADRLVIQGNAHDFDGVDDDIVVPSNSELKPDFPLTVSLWFKIDAYDKKSGIFKSKPHLLQYE